MSDSAKNDTPSFPTSQGEWEAHWAFYQLAIKERDFERIKCDRIERELTAARAEAEALRKDKDGAYLERNRLVSLLSKLFPSGRKKTAIEGWSDDWHGCVYIDFPWGQASWHYHDSHAHLFEHLPPYHGDWNGHTTEKKYAAIDAARSTEGKK